MFFVIYFKEIFLGITALIGLYLLKRNKNLTSQNQVLAETNFEKDKIINFNIERLDVSKNIKSTDLDGSLERLRKSEDKN